METSGTALNSNDQLDPQIKKGIEDRDRIFKSISESIKSFVNNRAEAIHAGLIPTFEQIDYMYSRIDENNALLRLMDGYRISSDAMIDFNKAGQVTTSMSEKKALYKNAANQFKVASDSFSESADLSAAYLKPMDSRLMEGIFRSLNNTVDAVRLGATKLAQKAEEAQQLSNNY